MDTRVYLSIMFDRNTDLINHFTSRYREEVEEAGKVSNFTLEQLGDAEDRVLAILTFLGGGYQGLALNRIAGVNAANANQVPVVENTIIIPEQPAPVVHNAITVQPPTPATVHKTVTKDRDGTFHIRETVGDG
jgi:ABC-type sugar transport system substrate-binding protein